MNVHVKPKPSPEMIEKAWRYVVECAGLDYDHDGYNPSCVVRLLIEKGIEAADKEARKPRATAYAITVPQIRDMARACKDLGDGDLRYGLRLIESVLDEIYPGWSEL